MQKFHLLFHAYKVGDRVRKMKKHQETIIADTIEDAKKQLTEYEQIRLITHGIVPLDLISYGILYNLTALRVRTTIHSHDGKIFQPELDESDKYILFEKTILPEHTEYFSNAWTSSNHIAIVARLKRYQTWWNHVDGTNSYGTGIGDGV